MTARTFLPALAATALLAGACGPSLAQSNPWYIGASQTFTHDSNIYRLGDGQAAPDGVTKSDTVSSTALLAGLDQPIGRQRLFGTLALRSNRFRANDVLDNEGYSLEAGIDWATIERWSGTVKLGANQSLASFNADTELGLITKKNLEKSETLDAVVRLGLVTRYSAEAGINYRHVAYSASEYDSRENSRTSVYGGLRYRPSGATMWGLMLRHTRGEYPRFEDLGGGSFLADKSTRNQVDLTLNVQPTGASTVYARVSLGRTSYDQAEERDYSGLTGALRWTWVPTGKLQFVTLLSRDTGQSSYDSNIPFSAGFTDFSRVTNALSLDASYAVTAKIRATAGATLSHRSLVRTLPPNPFFPVDATGSDTTHVLRLGASWEPTRSVVVGCDLGRERRSASGILSDPYGASTLGCYGQFYLR